MKKTAALLLLALFTVAVKAQGLFKTVVPGSPVVLGESFQVQYIADDLTGITHFDEPLFPGFRKVSGPNIYIGAKTHSSHFKSSKNYVFTLVPLAPGKGFIPGATISINGSKIKSNDAFVVVVSKEERVKQLEKALQERSDYFLSPGEDAAAKIRQNLFVKVLVDRSSCFVGEAILATFKLYSRLESKSDIVKNPGFYGFTVFDIVNLADRQVTTEKINGLAFDVHTIRKVQLYPLQAGKFMIDAMQLKNKIEFSRSYINKKTEQEIVEGILGNDDDYTPGLNKDVFENEISTEPVSILVKPVPEKSQPPEFNGAVGIFSIATAIVEKTKVQEQAILKLTVSGRGNFIQLNAPVVIWPRGIEGFEPVIKDSLNKQASPLEGKRTFFYKFVPGRAGNYIIPAISFCFFNPDSGHYKTITTNPQEIKVDAGKQPINLIEKIINPAKTIPGKNYVLPITLALLLAAVAIRFLYKKTNLKQTIVENKYTGADVDEIFSAVNNHLTDKNFYSALQKATWQFFSIHYRLSGTGMNKENLFIKMKERKIAADLITEVEAILQQCEEGMFTSVQFSEDRNLLLEKTKETCKKINQALL